MILSASRRTDLPAFYADWFYNRIEEGWLYVRNPMNPRQVSRVELSPETVDCIVFWTKNPEPVLEGLRRLSKYCYYFQVTLTCYGRDLEPGVPDKRGRLLPAIRRLSREVGGERVIWRYDPILINGRYTADYHERAFREIAEGLKGYTRRVVISFVDLYAKMRKEAGQYHIAPSDDSDLRSLAARLVRIAEKCGMEMVTCAERMDLEELGVRHGSCIDRAYIEGLAGYKLRGGKDRSMRKECGCMESIDVGVYHTCPHGCRYCYANGDMDRVRKAAALYDPHSPILCGALKETDRISERKVCSFKSGGKEM